MEDQNKYPTYTPYMIQGSSEPRYGVTFPGKIIVSYVRAKECSNTEAWFSCLQCGCCGRKFENGFMVDEGGTTPEEEEF